MTTTTDPAAHKLACVLATLHTAHTLHQPKLVASLLETLPLILQDEDIAEAYYATEVEDYLAATMPYLLSALDAVGLTDQQASEYQQASDSAFYRKDETGYCDNEGCICQAMNFDEEEGEEGEDEVNIYTNAEIISETDEHMVVVVYKK